MSGSSILFGGLSSASALRSDLSIHNKGGLSFKHSLFQVPYHIHGALLGSTRMGPDLQQLIVPLDGRITRKSHFGQTVGHGVIGEPQPIAGLHRESSLSTEKRVMRAASFRFKRSTLNKKHKRRRLGKRNLNPSFRRRVRLVDVTRYAYMHRKKWRRRRNKRVHSIDGFYFIKLNPKMIGTGYDLSILRAYKERASEVGLTRRRELNINLDGISKSLAAIADSPLMPPTDVVLGYKSSELHPPLPTAISNLWMMWSNIGPSVVGQLTSEWSNQTNITPFELVTRHETLRNGDVQLAVNERLERLSSSVLESVPTPVKRKEKPIIRRLASISSLCSSSQLHVDPCWLDWSRSKRHLDYSSLNLDYIGDENDEGKILVAGSHSFEGRL